MSTASKAILEAALGLTPTERAELIDQLQRSFDPDADVGAVDAWRAEAESRIDAFDAGELQADSMDAVFARINRR
jgi:putative addiction module component (TIGR02574 family)